MDVVCAHWAHNKKCGAKAPHLISTLNAQISLSAAHSKAVLAVLGGQVGDFNALDAGPAVRALDRGDKLVQRGAGALSLQRDAAVPVVGDPAGQAQMLGGGAGVIAEAS